MYYPVSWPKFDVGPHTASELKHSWAWLLGLPLYRDFSAFVSPIRKVLFFPIGCHSDATLIVSACTPPHSQFQVAKNVYRSLYRSVCGMHHKWLSFPSFPSATEAKAYLNLNKRCCVFLSTRGRSVHVNRVKVHIHYVIFSPGFRIRVSLPVVPVPRANPHATQFKSSTRTGWHYTQAVYLYPVVTHAKTSNSLFSWFKF
jgi:hypothetical protein